MIGLITLAAFFAGGLNALAGGGSFITLPALVLVGVPPVAANATGTAALLPGYLASAWNYRDLLQAPAGWSILAIVIIGGLGGVVGAGLLLLTTDDGFRGIIPWLLLLATLLFAFGPALQRYLAQHFRTQPTDTTRSDWGGRASVLAVAAYGGYFNGGMGIVMLALFRLLGVEDLRVANGLKNLLSAILTLIAVVIYTLGGLISWSVLLPMAIGATLGGWLGAQLGRVLPQTVLRYGIVTLGTVTTVLFFLELG